MQHSSEQIIDQILVMDAQSGYVEAVETLVTRWQKRLWWHACNITGDPQAAWDVTQESWLSILRGIARLKDPAKFGSWAYRIVTRKASDWRSRNSSGCWSTLEPDGPEPAADEWQKRETLQDVHCVIRRLPPRCRVVLSLYYLEGFGLAEIARILGTAEGTVKSRLHTARGEFRKLWESLTEPLPARTPAPGKGKTI